MQQLESDLDVTQEKLLNANQKLDEASTAADDNQRMCKVLENKSLSDESRMKASFSWFSRASMRDSSDKLLFSNTLHIRWLSSAAVEAWSSFCVAMRSLSSDFSRSSSSIWMRLLRAATSPSAFRRP